MRRTLTVTLAALGAALGFAAAAAIAADRVELERPLPRGGGPVPTIRALELVGRALPDVPHFEYTRTFWESQTIVWAIDPDRVPDLDGRTCELWVVPARSAREWHDDPGLVDARANGPTSHTFSGATIQGNTFVLAAPFALDATTAVGFGVGYDAVLDCDRDGRLSAGDAIDGAGDSTGLFVARDTTAAGPLAVTAIDYDVGSHPGVPPTHRRQMTYYPTAIDGMGALPLVVIGHGNGHDYTWYDYLGFHLASYGYVVMSHQNDTCPGVEFASSTTLGHTDAILAAQGDIAGGVLDGHIDAGRIVWVGHSRGGEGVLRAYDRIHDGHYTPEHFTLDDVILLVALAPTDFEGPAGTHPHRVPFHLVTASGDDDVAGGPAPDRAKPFQIYERAEGFRQLTVIQGAGHGDLHDGDNDSVFSGPCHIKPRSDVHAILQGYLVPLLEFYSRRNPAAKDFLWRQYEAFRPPGAPSGPCDVVSLEFRQPDDAGSFVIDDYDSAPSTATASSGAAVGFDVEHVTEGLLRDLDGTFDWNPNDPFNGMTRARASEGWRGVVFDWNAPAAYAWTIPESRRDWRGFDFLSLRACQQTRHPETTAELVDLTFSIELEDGTGRSRAIDVGTYGGGVEEPYQRDGGWSNEFETLRLRLADFAGGRDGPDLGDVATLRLRFGGGAGSERGRLGLDSVEVTRDPPAPLPGALRFSAPLGVPDELVPGEPTPVQVRVHAAGETVVTGSLRLAYRLGGGVFERTSLNPLGGGLHEASLPAAACGDQPEFYVTGLGAETGRVTLPRGGAAGPFRAIVARHIPSFADDFDTDRGWTTEVLGATAGQWQRGVAVNAGDWIFDPLACFDGGSCFLTQNETGNTDVDGGAVRLTSPELDLSHPGLLLRYAYFLRLTNEDGQDSLLVEAENGDGEWVTLERHTLDGGLSWRQVVLDRDTLLAAGLIPTATSRVRFTATDEAESSIVEAGVDAFETYHLECP